MPAERPRRGGSLCGSVGEVVDRDRGDGYRLEELGWLEFERLADLLVARGRGVAEVRWEGRGDEGGLAFVPGCAALPGGGRRRGGLLVVVLWSPGVGRERLYERVRAVMREAGVVPRSVVVITNEPDDGREASGWLDA